MRALSSFAIVVLGALVVADAAHARTCVFPSSSSAFVALGDRDTVPTNLVLFSLEVTVDDPDIVATSSDGSDVVVFAAVEVGGMFRFERERALLPDTEYSLCAKNIGSDFCRPIVTTATTDDEAPPPPTAAITDVHGLLRFERGCDGEGVDATVVVVEGEIAGDTSTAVLRRSVNGEEVVATLQNLTLRQNTIGLVDFAEEGGDALYSVTALDLAGNESEPTVLQQSLGCPGSCSQADATPLLSALAAFVVRAVRRRRSRDFNPPGTSPGAATTTE